MVVSCCALLASACGAGDNQLDPSDLELRDLLGISPETASAWDSGQRASARHVIEASVREAGPPSQADLDLGAASDQRVANTLAAMDADRAHHQAGALGLVHVAIDGGALHVTPHATTIDPQDKPPVEIWLSGWDREPLWELPSRGLDVMSALAIDAGHTSGPVVVTPAPRLAVVASYVPSTATEHARLAINPVVLAALDPVETGSQTSTGVERATHRGSSTPDGASVTPYATTTAAANPYSFYGSVAECAAAEHARCTECLANNNCSPITNSGNGNNECIDFDANGGRGYFLICVDLALAIDSVSKCTASAAPACSFDPHAAGSLDTLENNASFLDDGSCGGPLDNCLATIFGSSKGDFPGPGVDGGTAPPPRNTSPDCSDSCSSNDDSNCDLDPSCELDGPSCDDSESCDGSCSNSDEQSGCSDSGGDDGGGGCSGDSEDSCGSDNSSGCDNGDCGGGGDSGGGCSGGDCGGGGGGGDCGGGGGDCGGGGGDCGGGDCNAAGKRGHGGVSLQIVWAFLPIPFAAMVRRRARRKRALAEYEAQANEAQP
ncbi:MAG TPA: hypothetical protein VGO00_17520 [Kofleriaceae bacterium]|nr:hypothetical protein [Kofleriaceae bacterium]